MLKELPKAEYNEDSNFIFNDDIYVETDPMYFIYGFVEETADTVGHWEGYYTIHPVTGFGEEDFGEDICLRIMAEFPMPLRHWFYVKSGFEFPDYTTLTLSTIYLGDYSHQKSDIEIINFTQEDILLGDIMSEVDEFKCSNQYWKGSIFVFFKDYKTIYLKSSDLYEIDDELYVCIGLYTEDSKYYKINDDYVGAFQNAINAK